MQEARRGQGESGDRRGQGEPGDRRGQGEKQKCLKRSARLTQEYDDPENEELLQEYLTKVMHYYSSCHHADFTPVICSASLSLRH